MRKGSAGLLVAAGGAALILLALLFRKSEPASGPTPAPPANAALRPPTSPPSPPLRVGATVPSPSEQTQDPLIRRWQGAIRQRRPQEVLEVQAAFLAREAEYREPLMKLAVEGPDPRVRAFTVAVLGRLKGPPPEAFFLERLKDPEEYPRTSACQALERTGSGLCLPALEQAAAGDAAAAVREAASRAAKAVRSR